MGFLVDFKMKKLIKKILLGWELLGFSVSISALFVLGFSFYETYFIYNQTQFIIDFNAYGEAVSELIIIALAVIGILIYSIRKIREIKSKPL